MLYISDIHFLQINSTTIDDLSCWLEMLFRNCFKSQMQVPVRRLHTLGALMGAVSTPRGVMEILTAQMAVMK